MGFGFIACCRARGLRAMSSMRPQLRPRGAGGGLTGVVEHVHMSILDTPGFAPLAQEATRMCNNTANRVSVALAYTDGQGWVSEGWWNLKALDCATLLRGALAAQYYYVDAMDERGGEWKGKAFMCTTDRGLQGRKTKGLLHARLRPHAANSEAIRPGIPI